MKEIIITLDSLPQKVIDSTRERVCVCVCVCVGGGGGGGGEEEGRLERAY